MQSINISVKSKTTLIPNLSEFRSAFERRRCQKANWLAKAEYQLAAGGYSQTNWERELSASVNSQRDKPLKQLALACGGVSITQIYSFAWIPCCRICCDQAETLGSRGVKFYLLARKSNHIVFAAFLGLIFGKRRLGRLFSQSTGTPHNLWQRRSLA